MGRGKRYRSTSLAKSWHDKSLKKIVKTESWKKSCGGSVLLSSSQKTTRPNHRRGGLGEPGSVGSLSPEALCCSSTKNKKSNKYSFSTSTRPIHPILIQMGQIMANISKSSSSSPSCGGNATKKNTDCVLDINQITDFVLDVANWSRPRTGGRHGSRPPWNKE